MIQKLSRLTVGDMLDRFGPSLLERIRFDPFPGTATEQDIIEIYDREKRRCELIDGILIRKDMGWDESQLAMSIACHLMDWARPLHRGIVVGTSAAVRLAQGQVRFPDAAFISWDRMPNRRIPQEPIPDLAPDLAVEVPSINFSAAEMAKRLQEYFESDVRLVWIVDPRTRTVAVYTSPDQFVTLTADQTLDGGEVLPGFTLPLQELFAELDEEGPPVAAN